MVFREYQEIYLIRLLINNQIITDEKRILFPFFDFSIY